MKVLALLGDSITADHISPAGSIAKVSPAAEHLIDLGIQVIAGKEYGTGSSRDRAAKGTLLLGVRAFLTESFEWIHCSNLVDCDSTGTKP